MNETLVFILQLKEMMSGGMAKIASTAQSVFTGVDKRIDNTQRKFSMVGRSVSDLNTRLALLTQKRDMSIGTSDIARANREMAVLENRITRMQTVGVNKAGGGGLRMPWWLSGAMIGGVAAMGMLAMIKTGADQQRDVTGLSTFMGKQHAQAYYNQVQQDARVTPFVTHDLMAANRMLISTGMSADRARKDIMNLANAVAATGGSNYALERMAQHLQMIRSMGHASYLQLKEFTTNGINIMQLLSDATGKHIKMAHGMTVSYGAIERALAHAADKGGLFYNALFAQSQTIHGKWSTLVDDLELSAGKIVMSQSNAITGLLDLFDKYAQRLPQMAEQWGGTITAMTKGVIGLVSTLIDLGKWLYHNWEWLKYVVIAFYSYKIGIWAAAAATAIYNSVMLAMAAAEASAAAGAISLDAALMATPWGLIAAGVGVVAAAFLLAKKNADGLKDSQTKLATPAKDVVKHGDINARGHENSLSHVRLVKDSSAYYYDDKTGKMVHPGWKAVQDTVKDLNLPGQLPAALLQRWSDVGAGNGPTPSNGVASAAQKSKDVAADNADGDDGITSGSVTGGGGKKIYITFRNFTEHFNVNVKDMAEALNVTEEKFEEMFMRTMASIRASM